MILALHRLLKSNIYLADARISLFTLFSLVWFIMYFLKSPILIIPFNSIYFTIIPLVVLRLGMLNYPYILARNLYLVLLFNKAFQKFRYITINGGDNDGEFDLSTEKDGAVGLITKDKVYIDEAFKDVLLLWMVKNPTFITDFSKFLDTEVNKRDGIEIIKKKLLLHTLQV